jgi:hypothetical protein
MKLKFHTEIDSTKIQIGLDIDKRLPTKGKIKVWISKTSFHELSYNNFIIITLIINILITL